MTRIAWASATPFDTVDRDLPLLLDAARHAGLESEIARWDDPAVTWDDYDLVVVRSCWDYVPRREEFLAWTRTVPRLANDASMIQWNTDKSYLRELEAAGIPIVTTAWSVQEEAELPPAQEWVVKPTISAGAADTARWRDPAQAVAHGRRLLAQGRPTMTQPYVDAVDSEGETGLLLFGGTYSHAFRKGALLASGDDPRTLPELKEDIQPRTATADQVSFAERAVAAASEITGRRPLYARVDVVTGPDAGLHLMELELTEPSFFLEHTATGADSVVTAVIDRLKS